MENLKTIQLLAAIVAGFMGLSWLTRLLFTNYIQRNDEKHKKAQDCMNDLMIRLSIFETKLDTVYGVRDKIILLEDRLERLKSDINIAFEKIRNINKREI